MPDKIFHFSQLQPIFVLYFLAVTMAMVALLANQALAQDDSGSGSDDGCAMINLGCDADADCCGDLLCLLNICLVGPEGVL